MRNVLSLLLIVLFFSACGGQDPAIAPSTATGPGDVEVVFNADGTQARFAEGTHGHVILTGANRTWFQTFVRDQSQNQQTVRLSGVDAGPVDVLLTTFDDQGTLVGHAQARQIQVAPGAVTQILGSDLTGVGPSAGVDFNGAGSGEAIQVTVENGSVPSFSWTGGRAYQLSVLTENSTVWLIQANQPFGFEPPVTLGVTPDGAAALQSPQALEPGVTYYVVVSTLGNAGNASFVEEVSNRDSD